MENNIMDSKEKMILVGLNITDYKKNSSDFDIDQSMKELEELAEAAGGEVLGVVIQNKSNYDVTYYLGKGKAEEIAEYAQNLEADAVVFNEELSGAQIRNLEDLMQIKIIDRTALILDIFAKRAITKEGRLQVELAQYKYRLPRLIGMRKDLSRITGGIGSKGPGEKKLETDRRHIQDKIHDIMQELKEITGNRETQRARRLKSNIPIVALVGYTNAGKSTILNELIKSHKDYSEEKKVFVKDMLFATLDTALRKAVLPSKKEYLITDTVGFVSDLPHHLIEAFKATLEEVKYADVFLHIIDASNPNLELQIQTTEQVLKELGVAEKEMLYVFNKADLIEYEIPYKAVEPSIYVSAKTGYNMHELEEKIEKMLSGVITITKLLIPFANADVVNSLHKKYNFEEQYDENGFIIEVGLDEEDTGRYRKFIV